MKDNPTNTTLTCYQCGANLSIRELVCKNRDWGCPDPIFICQSAQHCKKDQVNPTVLNQRLEEEYQWEVKQDEREKEYQRLKKANGGGMFMFFGGSGC